MNCLLKAAILFVIFASSCGTRAAVNRKFANPVIAAADSPDPGAIFYNGYYYVVTTTNGGVAVPDKFPIHQSRDLQNWTLIGHVFPRDAIPKWTAVSTEFWAPEIHVINQQLRVYFTARDKTSGRLGIGVAVPVGPAQFGAWAGLDEPIVLDAAMDSIDATVIEGDAGEYYLAWHTDGTKLSPPSPTVIMARPLSADGLSVADPISELLRVTEPWEGQVVEGPWHVFAGGYHFLFYSGNGYCSADYAVGVARARSAIGPYEKLPTPILRADTNWAGPGHCSVVQDSAGPAGGGGGWAIVFHAWAGSEICGSYNRLMNVRSLSFNNQSWPVVE